ncbi:MAG: hypothetical protein K2M12_01890 [Muribaculaceae bacterium]|nr:hypothetical protein [Muribaculaceae bacterium]
MIRTIEIENLHCRCSTAGEGDRIAYVLYPMDLLAGWIEQAAKRYGVTIVVITDMDWETAFSPWPAKGVPDGSPDFKGGSPAFLNTLQQRVIPRVEAELGVGKEVERSLVGVSMSGLFALWQWMLCDTFANIASLSGSFWYEGFMEWMASRPIPAKRGMGYFLLGDRESKSKVKAFEAVGVNTQEIVMMLRDAGIRVEFESVPGNHYSDPIPRLEKAFAALYPAL